MRCVRASLFLLAAMLTQVHAAPGEHKVAAAAPKKLNVVTTLSVLKSLTEEVGGNLVEVKSLLLPSQDPHYIKPLPTRKEWLMKADMAVKIGMELELWFDSLVTSAGNKKLSGSGVVVASDGIRPLEVPSNQTRAHGDIHAKGNPHIWLSPINALKMADNIKKGLIAQDAAHKATYEANYEAFKKKVTEALVGLDLVKAAGVDVLLRHYEGKKLKDYLALHKKQPAGWLKLAEQIDYTFLTYHTVWSYLADGFGLKVFALNIEEKPGVEPGLLYRTTLIEKANAAHIKHIVVASYYEQFRNTIEKIASPLGAQVIYIDADCRDKETYVAMMDRIIKDFVQAKNAPKKTP